MPFVLFEQNGSLGKIILNNPDQLNAMTPEMAQELSLLIPKINKNKAIRVVIVTGAGRAFSAGGNLQFILDHTQKTKQKNKKEMVAFYSKFLSLREIKVPTLALIQGHAMGAGFCIAMACDLRVASSEAKMGVNFAKIGLSSGMGTLYFLYHLVGPAIAAELLFTGRTLSAEEAHRLGLINHVYPPSGLKSKAAELARQIAKNAPLALKIMKKGLQKVSSASLKGIFDYESTGQAISFATEDLKEGILALQQKRLPQFRGC